MHTKHRMPHLLVLFALCALLALPSGARAQSEQTCFAETGFCIGGRIREFWQQNGGLAVFGLPIGPQQEVAVEGRPLQVQWFERTRLELHRENARPYDVLLGRVGADRLAQQGRDPFSFPPSEPQPACRFFAETGHNVCGDILRTWRASGLEIDGRRGTSEAESLALFGLPLSDPVQETIEGRTYTVQWFERARFEVHPENQPPYNVLLGRLGSETQAGVQPAPAPTPAPAPAQPSAPACPELPPVVNGTLGQRCLYGGEVLAMVGQGFEPDEQVEFIVVTPDEKDMFFPVIAGDAAARPNGEYHITGALSAGTPAGVYRLALTGRSSGNRIEAAFRILPLDPARPVQDRSLLPPNQNGTAAPETAPRGARFGFSTTGFAPSTTVKVYAYRPDGQSVTAEFATVADGNGNAANKVLFNTDASDPVGIYKTVFESEDGLHKAVIYFRVTF